MFKPLEPVVTLGFRERNDRKRFEVEFAAIENDKAATYFKVASLLDTTVKVLALLSPSHLLDLSNINRSVEAVLSREGSLPDDQHGLPPHQHGLLLWLFVKTKLLDGSPSLQVA